jgi:hypothetical protein
MTLIDEELTREQFEYLRPEVAEQLLNALGRDLERWSETLLNAWDQSDAETIRLARHSIKGLCSNFGAGRMHELAALDLSSEASRREFRAVHGDTVEAIRRLARTIEGR